MERRIDGRQEMWVRAQGVSGLPLRRTRHWLPEEVFRVTEALSVLRGGVRCITRAHELQLHLRFFFLNGE